MRNVRRIFRVVLFVIAGLYLHYTLPQHDVAKVTGISDRLERLSSFQQIFTIRWIWAQRKAICATCG